MNMTRYYFTAILSLLGDVGLARVSQANGDNHRQSTRDGNGHRAPAPV